MIFYTGWVTAVTMVLAAMSLFLTHEVPNLTEGDAGSAAAIRWTIAGVTAVFIFVTGLVTNRKKVTRMGASGKLIEGAPNTVFFVPLQYAAFFYLFLMTCAILVWQTQEPLQ